MVKKVMAVLLAVLLAMTLCSCASETSEKQTAQQAALVFAQTDEAYASYDSSVVSAYADLCSAVFDGKSDVRMNLGLFSDVIQLFYTSYPLHIFVKDIVKKDDSSGVTVVYTEDAASVHQKANAFAEKVSGILKDCKKGSVNERAYAVNVYHYVATHISQSASSDNISVYHTVMTGEADSLSASGMLEYLLRQGGVKAAHVLATDVSGAVWGITAASFDDEFYYFDPMTEMLENSGEELCYFGMTDEDAAGEGLKKFVYTNQVQAAACDNPYFDACRHSQGWELSADGKSLVVTNTEGILVEIAL